MSLPQIFEFENHEVRTIENDGDVWFVAKDVAEVLGYSNTRDAISKHCKSTSAVAFRDAIGRDQEMTIIPERDVYRLVMRSKLPSAEKLENWVVSDVLPSIRKTGTFTAETLTPEMQMAHGLIAAQVLIEQKDATIKALAPKAAIADKLELAEGLLNLAHAAKTIGIPPQKFNQVLHRLGWIYRMGGIGAWTAYQEKIKAGYLDHKVFRQEVEGVEKVRPQVMVTPKGMTRLTTIFNSCVGTV